MVLTRVDEGRFWNRARLERTQRNKEFQPFTGQFVSDKSCAETLIQVFWVMPIRNKSLSQWFCAGTTQVN